MENPRSSYTLTKRVESTTGKYVKIFLVDNDHGMSVTNDAERVVGKILSCYPGSPRIIYRDTEGQWSELVHRDGKFETFAPYTENDIPQ